RAAASASPELLASADILGPEQAAPGNGSDGASPAAEVADAEQELDANGEDEEEDADDHEDDQDEDEDLGPVQRAAAEEDDDDDLLEEEPELDEPEEEAPEEETEPEEEPRDGVGEEPEDGVAEQPEDPNAAKRFWFEHATGAGKTVAALGFVEASQTGGVLILTHRRNLVDQFHGELRDRGYSKRISRPLLKGADSVKAGGLGRVTVDTYQWFVRNAGKISSANTIVIFDEAHTSMGDKSSSYISGRTAL